MLVIFDELFRGTNVKDAYDASLAIVSALAKVRQSFFMISTHIVEVANDLAEIKNISFKFMETILPMISLYLVTSCAMVLRKKGWACGLYRTRA